LLSLAIINGAPAIYRSTADVDSLAKLLRQAGVPADVSNRPTDYVCNHAYFIALHELSASTFEAPCLLVHVPVPSLGGAGPLRSWRRTDCRRASHLSGPSPCHAMRSCITSR